MKQLLNSPRAREVARSLSIVLAVSLVAGLAFNLRLLDDAKEVGAWKLARNVLRAWGLAFVVLAAVQSFRLTRLLLVPFFFLLGAIYAFYSHYLGLVVTHHVFDGLAQTDVGEVSSYVNPRSVMAGLAGLAVGAASVFGLWKLAPGRPTRYAIGLVGLAAWGLVTSKGREWGGNYKVFPFNIQTSVTEYVSIRNSVLEQLAAKKPLPSLFPFEYEARGDEPTVVLILGEAARSDHLGLNGYERPTTPRLAQEKNLVSLRQVYGCAYNTAMALPCLLTRATESTPSVANEETSIVSAFRAAGFDTTWIGADGRTFTYTVPINAMAYEAAQTLFHEEAQKTLRELGIAMPCRPGTVCDGAHWPLVRQVVQQAAGKRAFVVVQTHGSHLPFLDRYPEDFAKFQPECMETAENVRKCDRQSVINTYDNSVVYTDHLLSELIGDLRDRNALLVYVADHGQHLGEDDRYFHGFLIPDAHSKEVRHVPWMIWASDTFVARNPEIFERVRALRDAPVTHDHVFHSLLDCAGVRSSAIDPKQSVCSTELNPVVDGRFFHRTSSVPPGYRTRALEAEGNVAARFPADRAEAGQSVTITRAVPAEPGRSYRIRLELATGGAEQPGALVATVRAAGIELHRVEVARESAWSTVEGVVTSRGSELRVDATIATTGAKDAVVPVSAAVIDLKNLVIESAEPAPETAVAVPTQP